MRRACLTGVESTGKTSLVSRLAAHFAPRCKTLIMPELGRSWAELHGTEFSIPILREIAAGHIAARDNLIAAAPDLIIEDTDIIMTSAWANMLHGARDPLLTAIPATADLYLLFAPDTPWIGDGTRMFGGDKRARFHAIITDELARRGISAVTIEGDWQQREAAAIAAITPLLPVPATG